MNNFQCIPLAVLLLLLLLLFGLNYFTGNMINYPLLSSIGSTLWQNLLFVNVSLN